MRLFWKDPYRTDVGRGKNCMPCVEKGGGRKEFPVLRLFLAHTPKAGREKKGGKEGD